MLTWFSGPEFIIPISGFFCKLCSKFYNKEKAAMEYHCSTDLHDKKVKVNKGCILRQQQIVIIAFTLNASQAFVVCHGQAV